jgi:CTP:molybdopterin cytidylyltransferase MocA
VTVLILHPLPGPGAGGLVVRLAAARAAAASRIAAAFRALGVDEARVIAGPPDDIPFGARLRALARPLGERGIVVLGSGALPLASAADLRRLVEVAASGEPIAATNARYSADVIALGRADLLADLPDLETDNALPRWLEEVARVPVRVVGGGWRSSVDLDTPLDLLLIGAAPRAPAPLRAAAIELGSLADRALRTSRLVASTMRDPGRQLLVAGRTSSGTLRWLERSTASRTRALVEERGLKASSRLALPAARRGGGAMGEGVDRPPASILGMLLERDGPEALGAIVGRLADAAVIDTRVLLAARSGPDERGWPGADDRFASDLLAPERIHDPWLAALTRAAVAAPAPILLGGHTLVGPGLRLVARIGTDRS